MSVGKAETLFAHGSLDDSPHLVGKLGLSDVETARNVFAGLQGHPWNERTTHLWHTRTAGGNKLFEWLIVEMEVELDVHLLQVGIAIARKLIVGIDHHGLDGIGFVGNGLV